MEELLNKLIEKGWKPRDIETLYIEKVWNDVHLLLPERWHMRYSMRKLTSKESGLWQYVCENGMVKKLWDNLKYFYNSRDELGTVWYYEDRYKYRLIESALCDEDKLEQFLLDNILQDENKKESTQDN